MTESYSTPTRRMSRVTTSLRFRHRVGFGIPISATDGVLTRSESDTYVAEVAAVVTMPTAMAERGFSGNGAASTSVMRRTVARRQVRRISHRKP